MLRLDLSQTSDWTAIIKIAMIATMITRSYIFGGESMVSWVTGLLMSRAIAATLYRLVDDC